MRRHAIISVPKVASQFMPVTNAIRQVAQRRMLIPIGLQAADNKSMIDAQLLIKWTSMTKRYFHMVPLILESGGQQDQAEALSGGRAPSRAKASRTFRRITLTGIELSSILCVFEGKLPAASFVSKGLSMKFEKGSDGTITLKGSVIPYEEAGIDESKKLLFAGVLDKPTGVLFKCHLESILTEIFGIEHHHYVIRRGFHTQLPGQHNGQQHRSSPRNSQASPQRNNPVLRGGRGQFASQVEDDAIIVNEAMRKLDPTAAPLPSPASEPSPVDAENIAETLGDLAANRVVSLEGGEEAAVEHEKPPSTSKKASATKKKVKGAKNEKKSKARSDKKNADAAAQELFEM